LQLINKLARGCCSCVGNCITLPRETSNPRLDTTAIRHWTCTSSRPHQSKHQSHQSANHTPRPGFAVWDWYCGIPSARGSGRLDTIAAFKPGMGRHSSQRARGLCHSIVGDGSCCANPDHQHDRPCLPCLHPCPCHRDGRRGRPCHQHLGRRT